MCGCNSCHVCVFVCVHLMRLFARTLAFAFAYTGMVVLVVVVAVDDIAFSLNVLLHFADAPAFSSRLKS